MATTTITTTTQTVDITQIFNECPNARRIDQEGDRMFCARANCWVTASIYCVKCSPEGRQPATYEW